MKVAMVVAEPSGDNIAANLIRTMKARNLEVDVSGICGPAMMREGAAAHYTLDDISALGIEGLIGRLRKILKIRKDYTEFLLGSPPDIYIGIDAPDFNLSIEKRLRRAGIPTLQYVAPTVWAWRGYRIHKLKKAVDHLLTIYPFESALFDRAGIPYTYIGHPLADEIAVCENLSDRSRFGLSAEDRVVAILPGSRANEVSSLASIFLNTAESLAADDPTLKFIAPFINDATCQIFRQTLDSMNCSISVQIVMHESLNVIAVSDLVIAASGTAALETALLGKPVVVSYRLSRLSYWMVKVLTKTNFYSMLNHFDGGPVIPEFMQNDCTAENLTREAQKLLHDEAYRARIIKKFDEIAVELRQNANQLAVGEITRLVYRDKA